MNGVLLTSIVLRLVGVGYSLVLLRRSGDRRFGFLTVLLTFMAARQLLTAASTATTGLEEIPGLVVSGLAFLTIHYLDRYVDEERRLTRKLQAANDELCTFKKAVEHAGHAIFFTDPDGTITYANPSIEAVTGYSPEEVVGENPRLWKSGEHQTAYYEEMWETISRGDVWDGEIVNQDASGEQHWVDMTIAPVTNGGEIEQFVAVDSDVTERKRRERRIERQNERLVRLNRMNQLLRDVNRRLVTATTRDDVERTVVDRLVSDAQVVAAGIVDRTASGRLRTRYVAGETDVVEGLLDDATDELTVVTAAVDHGQTDVSTSLSSLDGVETAADTIGVVPLSFRNSRYGALVVATRTPEFFETISSDVRAELGDTIGSAINAADRRRELVDDRITELTFAVNDTSAPLFALARESERDVELVRTTAGRECERVLFVRIHDVDGETAQEAVAAVADLDDPTVVSETESACVIRVVATDTETLADELATHGATIGELSVAAGTLDGELVVDVPTGVDVRPIVETLRMRFEVCDLVGRRERERTVDTAVGFREELEAVLTDRQLEALRIAQLAGYFEWPREHSGEEVASMMDVCQSTYMQHLRAAERKLTAQLFDSDTMGRRLTPGSAVG